MQHHMPTWLTSDKKNTGHLDLGKLPWLVTLCTCHTLLPGKLGTCLATPLGGDTWKVVHGFF